MIRKKGDPADKSQKSLILIPIQNPSYLPAPVPEERVVVLLIHLFQQNVDVSSDPL